MRFRDRTDAGQRLARELACYANRTDVCVLALPRGGVPVAYEVAQALHAPLDVWVVRKLGTPFMPELALGAIASGDVRVLTPGIADVLHLSHDQIEQIAADERIELQRREDAYRAGQPPIDVRGKIVILIDDGVATGSTMRAGIQALRQLKPAQIVAAIPVAARSACQMLAQAADRVVCLSRPETFEAVGEWYVDFSQTTDQEVRNLLRSGAESVAPKPI
ncbi:MAG TPA: phosphoribosyltransferase [Terriglobales bacterium]